MAAVSAQHECLIWLIGGLILRTWRRCISGEITSSIEHARLRSASLNYPVGDALCSASGMSNRIPRPTPPLRKAASTDIASDPVLMLNNVSFGGGTSRRLLRASTSRCIHRFRIFGGILFSSGGSGGRGSRLGCARDAGIDEFSIE